MCEEAGRLHVDDEDGVLVQRRDIAGEHDADLVGEDLVAGIVDDAAAVAVAVEAEADIGAVLLHGIGDGVQHLQVFGVRIVVREGVVELGVERHDVGAERCEHARREGAGGAVAAGGDHLHPPRPLRPVGEVGDVALGETRG